MFLRVILRHSVLFAMLTVAAVALGDDKPGGSTETDHSVPHVTDAEIRKARLLLNGVWNSIDKIASGVVKVHRMTTRGPDGPLEVEDYLYAFNRERDCVRFDYHGPQRTVQYIRNETEILQNSPSSSPGFGIASRHPRNYKVIFDARPIDFRWIGVLLMGSVQNKRSPEVTRTYLDNAPLLDVNDTGKQVHLKMRCDVDETKEGICNTILDREQGLMPVLIEDQYRRVKANEVRGWYVESRNQTKWAEMSGVWVPVTTTVENVRIGFKSEFQLEWENVNDVLPHQMFEMEGFDLDDGTTVLNAKLGEPISEGRHGEAKLATEALIKEHDAGSATRRWLITINVTVLIAGVAIAGVCRLMRKRNGG